MNAIPQQHPHDEVRRDVIDPPAIEQCESADKHPGSEQIREMQRPRIEQRHDEDSADVVDDGCCSQKDTQFHWYSPSHHGNERDGKCRIRLHRYAPAA